MHRCNSDVSSIRRGLAWDFAGSQNARRQLNDLGSDVQQGNIAQRLQSMARCRWVPGANFINDELRQVKPEFIPPRSPPFPCDLLMAGYDQITVGREVR